VVLLAIRDAATRFVGHGRKNSRTRKRAETLYKSQDPAEQRRLLETVLSNCTFDSGSLCPTYSKPFDLLVRGTKPGNGGEGGIRTQPDSLDSVSCRFHVTRIAGDASVAVAPCTLLHARLRLVRPLAAADRYVSETKQGGGKRRRGRLRLS